MAGVSEKSKSWTRVTNECDILLTLEKGIWNGINHVMHRHAEANNRYIKDYDPSTESSYFMYWDVNNLYEWLLSQKLPVDGFK